MIGFAYQKIIPEVHHCFTVAAHNVARWNGSAWSALGAGVQGRATALERYGSMLYVGGEFDTAGTIAAKNIARWDSANGWTAVGTGVRDTGSVGNVQDMMTANGKLFVGGYFTEINGSRGNCIMQFDGSNWTSLGSGVRKGAYTMTIGPTGLYVGGNLYLAGEKPSRFFARWTRETLAIEQTHENSPPPQRSQLQNSYPLPSAVGATIDFYLAQPEHVRLTITDMQGTVLATLIDQNLAPGKHSVRWDGRNYDAGVYFYRLQTASEDITKKIMLSKK